MAHRVRRSVPAAAPRYNAPEGQRAAWWRENQMRLSRPALAERLGIKSNQTIGKFERMTEVPLWYRLACASIAANLKFDWQQASAKIRASEVTF